MHYTFAIREFISEITDPACLDREMAVEMEDPT
jgi:hypothetical protein